MAAARAMRVVLGLHDGHDAGVCLFVDGHLRYALNEERLSRRKNHTGFPALSLARLLADCALSPGDVDAVAVAGRCGMTVDIEERLWGSPAGAAFTALSPLGRILANPAVGGLERALYFPPRWLSLPRRLRGLGFRCPVRFVDHHAAHAASAFFGAPGDLRAGSAVLTVDAAGDGVSATASAGGPAGPVPLARSPLYDSIGAFYQALTKLLGFRILRHEGKVTGLAAYGDPARLGPAFAGLWGLSPDGLRLRNHSSSFGERTVEVLRRRAGGAPREDVAAAGQRLLEEVLCGHAAAVVRRTGARHLLLAGGVFANVRLNQRLHDLPGVRGVFVFPHMGDGGLAVGAAMDLLARAGGQPSLPGPFLGPDYGEDACRAALREAGVEASRPPDLAAEVARRLAAGQVVARFAGRLEYGPRALSHRSVLCSAADPAVNDWLNARLRRSEFMPFAPLTLAEDADACYERIGGSRAAASYMTVTFDCTPRMRREAPAAVHVDGTARPQLLAPGDDPECHRILLEHRRLTGASSVVNTSFNLHEEPIVCSPGDALRAFREARLDALALGPFLVAADPADAPSRAAPPRAAPAGGPP